MPVVRSVQEECVWSMPAVLPIPDARFTGNSQSVRRSGPQGQDGEAVNIKECATCKWARFDMTNHTPPHVNRNHFGECTWPLPELPPVATCWVIDAPHKSCIWPRWGKCPVWEAKP